MGKINGISQNQMLRSDLGLNNNNNAGKVASTKTADVAAKYTQDHNDNISHGFKRFILFVFTLGINELFRSSYAKNYDANITKMSDDLGKIHAALKEEVGEKPNNDFLRREYLYGFDHNNVYVERETELQLSMGTVTLTRHASGTGTLRFPDGSTEEIEDCGKIRRQIEIDVMKNAKIFRKSLVLQILEEYRDKITSEKVPISADAQNTNDFQYINELRSQGDDTRATIRSAARRRMTELLGILFKENLNLPEEITATLEPNFAVDMAEKLLDGELDDPQALTDFLNKGISGTNLSTKEAMELATKLENAQADYNLYKKGDSKIRSKYDHEPPNPASLVTFGEKYVDRKTTAFLPQGESRQVHDFAAEILLNEDATKYDNSIEQGRLTGSRLTKIFQKNNELVGKLMANRLAVKADKKVPDMLATLEPGLAETIGEMLDKLNVEFDEKEAERNKEIENAQKALERAEKSHVLDEEEKAREVKKCRDRLDALRESQKQRSEKPPETLRASFVKVFLAEMQKAQGFIAFKMGAMSPDDINPEEIAYRSANVTDKHIVVQEKYDPKNGTTFTFMPRAFDSKEDKAAVEMQEDARKIALSRENPEASQAEQARMRARFDFFSVKEEELNKGVKAQCEALQAKINEQIEAVFTIPEDRKYTNDQLSQMSLAEMQRAYASSDDVRLVKAALKRYFKDMPIQDQRRMLAAQTRFCELHPNTTEGAKLGALLKGAGPVMQKMLQGLDETLIRDESFKEALADMKDGLAPLAESTIRAHFFDMIQRSEKDNPKNPIKSIKILGAIGQASVAQALNCEITFKDGSKEECVNKVLRPDAAITMEREDVIFTAAAEEVKNGMPKTYKGRYKSIREEFDFIQEAKNVQRGREVYASDSRGIYQRQGVRETYGTFKNIDSEQLVKGVNPTKTSLPLKNAGKKNLKQYLAETSGIIKSAQKKIGPPNEINNNAQEIIEPVSIEELKKLDELSKDLRKKYSSLTSLSFKWINEGLFGSGFSNNDLHSGNLIISEDGEVLIIIDFGNCMQLTKQERTNEISTVSGVSVCDVDLFLKGFRNLLATSEASSATITNYHRHLDEIKARLAIVFSEANKGLDKTPQRLDVALKILQKDYGIEIPPQIHNFLQGQTRLQNTMSQFQQQIEQLDEVRSQYANALEARGALSDDEKTAIEESRDLTESRKGLKSVSMMKCMIDVVANNINATLLKAIGMKNASGVYNSIKGELDAINGN